MMVCQDLRWLYQLQGVVEDRGWRQGEETQDWASRALVAKQALRSPKVVVKDTNSWRGPAMLVEKVWPTLAEKVCPTSVVMAR